LYGLVFSLVLTIPCFATIWTETTNADFWDGFFYGSTMNQSNSLRMTGNFTTWRKESTNPVFSNSTGNTWDNKSALVISTIWDSDDNLYKLFYQGNNDTSDNSWKNGLGTSPNGTIFDRHDFNPIMDAGTGWESVWVDGPDVIRHNSTFYEMWYNGYDGSNYNIGYGNSTNGTNWTKYETNPVVNTSFPIDCGALDASSVNAGEKHVWIEDDTYFMVYICDSSSSYMLMLMNFTDPRDLATYQAMNGGQPIIEASDIGKAEVQPTGLLKFRYNTTHNIYYLMLGFMWGDKAYTLIWSFDKLNWNVWDSGATVLPIGSGWEGNRVNWGGFVTDKYGYLQQKSGDNDILFYYVGQETGNTYYRTGLAYPYYTWARYESDINSIGSVVNITEVSWTNTTCNGCDVKIQVGNSTDGSTFTWSNNYTSSPQALNLNTTHIQYRVWFDGNDTNYPTLDDITITYSPPETVIYLWLNGTQGNKGYTQYDIANFTAQTNIEGLTVNISTNLTGWSPEPSDTTTVYNTTNLTELGVFNITGYTLGNASYSGSSTTYYATVTTGDNPPAYSNIQTDYPSSYADQVTWKNITWTDTDATPVDTVFIESNYSGGYVNYTAYNISDVYFWNLTLPAGTFQWKSYANDTADQWTTSPLQTFTINQATPPITLTANTSWTVYYPTPTNVSGGGCPTQITCTLYRDDTEIATPDDNQLLSVGNYFYVWNTSGGQNYSSNSVSNTLIVLSSEEPPIGLTVRYNQTQNTDGDSIWNETLTESGNNTFYVNLPKNSTVVSANLNLSGYESWSDWNDTSDATACDDNVFSCSNAFDENWDSFAYHNSWGQWKGVYENYTQPNMYAKKFNVTVKTRIGSAGSGGSMINISIWNYTSNSWLIVISHTSPDGNEITFEDGIINNTNDYNINSTQPLRIYVYGAWIGGGGTPRFFETKIKWISNISNPYLDVGNDGDKDWEFSGEFNHTDNQTSDLSSEIQDYLSTCIPYEDGTCDVPFVLHSDSAGKIEVDLSATITYDTETYDSSVYEGQNTTFWIKLNSTSDITDVNGTLVWNDTDYSHSTKSQNGTYWTFTRVLTVPTVVDDVNISFYWNFTYVNSTGTYVQNFSSKNQYVYGFGLTNCTGGNITLNFTAYDEENYTNQLNFSMDLYVNYWVSSDVIENFSYSYTGNDTYYLCIVPPDSEVYANITIRYWNASYPTRYRYYRNTVLTNTTQNISLYLLNSTNSQNVLFQTYNNQEYQIPNAIISNYRLMGTDWNMVVNGITDDTGSYTLHLDSTMNYNIIITATGYVTKNIYLIPVLTTYKIYLQTGETIIPSYWTYWNQVSGTCTYTNSTRILNCVWDDNSEHLTAIHLQVTITNNTNSISYCDNSSSLSEGQFVCNFGEPANNTFIWAFWGEFGSIASRIPFDSGTWTDIIVVSMGLTGLLVTFLLVVTAGGLGLTLHNPMFTIIMILIGVGASFLLGMIDFASSMLSVIIGFFIAGGILVFKMR